MILLALSIARVGISPAQESPAQKPKGEESGEQVVLKTQLVSVFFTVTDRRNAILTDVRRDEVKVFENGREQEIFAFARQTDLPLTIVVLIDISGSQQHTLPEEKAAATAFLRSVVRPSKDRVALVAFRDEVLLVEDFTSTIARLESALARLRVTLPTGHDPESRFGGTSLYDAVVLTCRELLAREPGRRTILLLTDGEDTTSVHQLSDAIEAAWRVEATIYAIGIGDRFRFGVNEGVLKRLAQETGGRAYFPRSARDLHQAFRQIEIELRSQYLLAYYPTTTEADERFRQIEIRIPGRKGVRIRHRRGYYPMRAKMHEEKRAQGHTEELR